MMKGIFKLACAFGAMAAPTYGGWLWGQVNNLEAGVVILCLAAGVGAACMHGFATVDRREV